MSSPVRLFFLNASSVTAQKFLRKNSSSRTSLPLRMASLARLYALLNVSLLTVGGNGKLPTSSTNVSMRLYCPPNSFKPIARLQHLDTADETSLIECIKKGNFNAKP